MKRISKAFNPENKRSVKNLHSVLDYLLNEDVYKTEEARKTVGKKTRMAIKEIVPDIEVPTTGKLEKQAIDRLNRAFIDKKYAEKEHITELHKRLKTLEKKNFIKENLKEKEVKDGKIGASTKKLIKTFQKKYNLEVTGEMNPETDERLESVITSIAGSKPRPKKKLKVDKPSKLNRTVRFLRLNMTSEKVQDLQKGLSWLGYKIHKDEFDAKTFGKTTRDAVLKFQEANKLSINGEVDRYTSNLLNKKLAEANPEVLQKSKYRVRGSIRDELWEGKSGVKVQVYEKGLRGSDNLLGERTTFQNGFFDITYNPPVDPSTKKPKSTYHLLVKVLDENDNEIHSKTYKKASQVLWANYTEGEDRYKGASEFETMVKTISGPLGSAGLDIKDIEQSDAQEDISQLALETQMLPEEIMKLSLSHRISDTVGNSSLPPEVFYAFLKQNLPPEMPGDLFPDEPDEWEEWTPRLVEQLTNGIVFLEPEIQESTLNNTLEQNIVPRQLKVNKDKAMQALQTLRTEFTLQKPLLIGDGNLGMLLDTSSVNEEQYQTIANTFISNQGLSQNFWDELEEAGELDKAALEDFRQTVDLGFISRNHQPAVQLMKGKIGDASESRYTSSRDFAKLSQSEWVDLITDEEGAVPENIDGASAEERNKIYATTLKGNAERLFPGVSLVAEVERNSEHGLTHVSEVESFMDDNATFDLGKDDVTKINIEAGNALSDQALQEAKVLQRVHRIAPSSLAGTALLNEKLHSSIQIYFKGQDRLTELMVDRDIAKSDALRIYNLAEHQYANVLARITQFRFDFLKDNPIAVPDFTYSEEEIENFKDDLPNLEVLFGSLDFCECKHCSSMYSPAAYLTDLLRFLGEKDAETSGDTVRDVLFDRRPDIGNIKLDCDNTNTPLLYIDLVNEILENAIPPTNSDFDYNTTLSAAELQAIPEHIRPDAYIVLKNATRPMNHAFNLWQEETRMFLEHLGVPRYKLMETWQNESDPANKIPEEVAIATEFFGISAEEQQIITPASPEATTAKQDEYWDFDSTQTSIPVSLFMEKSNITYLQLLEFLQCRYVNPEDGESVINRPVDNCDVDMQLLNNLSQEKLDHMHRFLRLWRRTGWKMWELDLLIRSPKIGNGAIDEDCLVALKRFKELQDGLSVPVEELLAFYDDINTEMRATADESGRKINPLYHRLFLNVAVSNPIDTNFELPLGGGETLSDHTTTILSALAIRDEDFNLLSTKTDGQLTVESLSTLYRYVSLAKKLRLSVKTLLLLLDITFITDPFESPEQTDELLKYHQAVKASGFTLIELNYVLNYAPDSPAGLREEVLVQYIEALRTGLTNLNDEIQGGNASPRERAEKHLSKISEFNNQDTLTKALDLIEGKWVGVDAERESFIDDHFGIFIPADADPATMLSEESFYDGDPLTEAEENAIMDRYAYVLDHLRPFLSTNLIKEHIASNLDIGNQQVNVLLTGLSLPGGSSTLLQHLQDKKLIEKNTDGDFVHEINDTNYPKLFRVYRLLHKVSIIINNIQLESHDLQWFIDHHSEIEVVDLQALPVDGPPSDPLFKEWYSLWRIIEFKRAYPEPDEVSFYDILEMGIDNTSDVMELLADLAMLTQWDEENLVAIHQGLNLQHSGSDLDYVRAETYHHLKMCVGQMRRTGVDAETMFDWATRSDETRQQSIAKATRQAAKSKYETDEWLDKVKPIEDELREKKRDALVAYLLDENPDMDDSGDLFNYFLIDVKMNACQLTSRLKQAISSVQLFVQRCFLNLESEFVQVPKDDPDLENSWKQWKWMKNYRIWEANRKVFFYPENWIEPDLRDDKSSFFKELENDIHQNEVTHENVEEAYLNYLQKVDEVSNLEVIGMYHDFHSDGEELVHVIGRTKSIPHIYYHRTYSMDYFTWSAWEKLDIDITGDHAIPVVYNRKLHLFWLVFNERPIKIEKIPGAQPSEGATEENPEPPKILEIQLAWSVKKHNGWTPKVISKKKMIHPWQRPHFSYHIKPRYKVADNTMWVDLYISTSEEFNNKRFLDQHSPDYSKSRKTSNRFNQTYRPWHSSSFVFNGNVQKLKLRGLMGHYYLPGEDEKKIISSYQYVHENFGEEGRALEKISYFEEAGRLVLPVGMHYRYNALTNNRAHSPNSAHLNVVPTGFGTKSLLKGANNPFEAVIPMQSLNYRPFIYQDNKRAFFVKPGWKQLLIDYYTKETVRQHVFYPFYHPYTELYIRELNRSGLDGLLTRKIQTQPESYHPQNTFDFNSDYNPVSPNEADESAEKDIVDFSFGGAYSIYNWELFFHAPMMIAGKLNQNQRFEEAMQWYHYIFDPTNTDNLPVPERYWVTKPFYEHSGEDYRRQRIQNLIDNIEEFSDQVIAWKNDPFKPHLIARYRPVAYQRNVVMKYIDNLIDWGDQLFRRDTMESINEASLLYMLAYELLGDRPESVPAIPRSAKSFNELLSEGSIDDFANTDVEVAMENELNLPIVITGTTDGTEPMPRLETSYFCISRNDKLDAYWDRVEDRLFKIRNCMNIEGIVRQLPLFAPPIDPALLVKAAAAGIDLGSVLNDLSVPNPNYRFRTLAQSAIRFCSEVKTLGDKLLQVLEKKDAEGLAVLRSSHEIKLLEAIKEVRELQIEEAEETVLGLKRSQEIAEEKESEYSSREFMNSWETTSAVLNGVSIVSHITGTVLETISAFLVNVPDFYIGAAGFGGSPVAVTQIAGGSKLAASLRTGGSVAYNLGTILDKTANLTSQIGNYERRQEEWDLQQKLAEIEIEQIAKQIAAAEVRVNIAEQENDNQQLQIEQAEAEDEYLRNKYTNEQLYNWMLSQVSSVYFQAYQLAYDMAKKAEKSFRYELGLSDSSFIQFGYWDSLKKGLMSGDKLMHDIYRMESAYYDQHDRELELTKHISLAQVAPACLINLKITGECTLEIPEWLFDMDYPGHYMRRIKTVSVSIPCVTGPYTGIHCSLALHNSKIRVSNLVGSSYEMTDADDDRFTQEYGTVQSIATSHGQNDTGLFELNFSDERYLPFEGAGAISTWGIKMPPENNQFDFSSISDVIIHLQYTARDGGANLGSAAQTNVNNLLPENGLRMMSLNHEFGNAWHRFLYPAEEGSDQELLLDVKLDHYPFYARSGEITVSKLELFVNGHHDGNYVASIQLPTQPSAEDDIEISEDASLNDTHYKEYEFTSPPDGTGEWRLKIRRDSDSDFTSLPPDDIEDVLVIVHFEIS